MVKKSNSVHLRAAAAMLIAFAAPAFSAVIFDNADPPLSTTFRIQGSGAYLHIDGPDVTISQISINAAPLLDGQLKFLIFSNVAPPGSNTKTLLLSDTVDVVASASPSYILSNPISFTLLSGQYYDIGAIFSIAPPPPGTSILYTYDMLANTQNGITSIGSNANFSDFDNPIAGGNSGGVDINIRLYSAENMVPEPATPVLLGVGLAVGAFWKLALSRTVKPSSNWARMGQKTT